MSNFPPHYRPSYNPSHYMTPSDGKYKATESQYSYHDHAQALYSHGQIPANGVSPAPHANAYSFNVNGQDVAQPEDSMNGTFSGNGIQPYPHALPSTSFPPTSIARATSHFPHNSNQAAITSTIPPTHVGLPSEALQRNAPLHTQDTCTEEIRDSPGTSDLEDGEVDDEESKRPLHLPEVNEMGMVFSRPPVQEQELKNGLTLRTLSNGHNEVTHRPVSGQVPDSLFEYEDGRPNPSHRQQPPKPKGNDDASNHSPYILPEEQIISADLVNVKTTDANEITNAEIMAKTKEMARQALLDLHSHGHDFTEIVEHGMDPSVLRMLCAEVGIPIESSPSSQLQQELEVNARGAPSSNATNEDDKAQLKGLKASASTQHKDEDTFTKTSLVTSTGKEKDSMASSATTNMPKNGPKDPLEVKAPGPKATDTKPLDRKEYIARMLAAKAGKPVASTISTTPLKPSTAAASESVYQPLSSSAPMLPSMPTITSVAREVDQIAPEKPSVGISQSRQDDQSIDAKRKAQTELARQKMETLKSQRGFAKATGSSDSADQILPSVDASQPPTIAPIVNPQPPTPVRQDSFFSPVSQRMHCTIPGLFMTPAASSSVKPPVCGPNQSPVASAAGNQEPSLPAVTFPKIPLATEAAPIREPGGDAKNGDATAAPALTHRKRQKAADFLDPPSTRVKRPLGQQVDSSVIIDISDEDMADSSDADSIDLDIADARMTASKTFPADDSGSSKRKSIGDLPPLSNLPSRKRPPPMTPSVLPPSNHATDSKGLRSKEMEIESMNRKIAELEQRITAKKTTSRAATPGGSGNSAPQDSSRDAEGTSRGVEVPEAANSIVNSAHTRQSTLPDANDADTRDAEQKLYEVERAKASVERSLAADVAQASYEQQTLQDGTSQHLQVQTQSTLGTELQRINHLEDAGLQPVEQQMPQDDQRGRGEDEDTGRLNNDEPHPLERVNMQLQETKVSPQDEGQTKLIQDQLQMRRRALESGLPVLDASVEKTKQKLKSMREEIAELEREVQKGAEGRKALIRELELLSQAEDRLPVPGDEHLPDILNTAERPSEEAKSQAAKVLSSHVERIAVSELSTSETAVQPQESATTLQQEEYRASVPPLRATTIENGTVSDEEPEEDVMDISRSEVDEGELFEYSPKLPNTAVQQTEDTVDDEGRFQPSTDGRVVGQQSTPDRVPLGGETVEIEMAGTGPELSLTNEREAGRPPSLDRSNHSADPQNHERVSHSSRSLADDSDPDDYEPPEPALPLKGSAVESDRLDSIHEVDINNNLKPSMPALQQGLDQSSVQKRPASEPLHIIRHFTPYESPLKHFKSYRNHPEYLNDVPHGFRSLTYSHAINSEIPICRYELDGVCNDASCQSQHFKSLGLSDEKILVDLGSTPKDSDATAYTDGLKLLVQDIRARKIKDVNKVASEITAYRRKFLGDTRIISL